MPYGQRKKLGDLLLDAGYISKQQLGEALQMQKTEGKRLAELLIDKGIITEDNMLTALSKQLKLPYRDIQKTPVDPEAPRTINEALARKYVALPFRKKGDTLCVAINDPLNVFAVDDIKIASGCGEVELYLDKRRHILNAIDMYYGRQNAERAMEDFSRQLDADETGSLADAESAEVANAPVVRLVDSIIRQAVALGASDIHIEPFDEDLRVRLRVDGVLQEIMRPPKNAHAAIVTRIKLIGGMEIAEKRLPQDGRYETVIDGMPVDLRISSLPTVYGEKIVIRVLERKNFDISKEKLGFEGQGLKAFNAIIQNPSGIVLISGPTGSGKTTTLYVVLNELNTESKNIITVEDPVEYRLDGILQVQVNNKAGLHFSNGLRSILRQDPDIIMIGEMRDRETAEIAMNAAITGHLVLSTIHTNDTASAVTRLMDMGIEPFFIATAVVGIVAQRLVRKICTDCREAYTASDYELLLLGLSENEVLTLHRGKGCDACNHTGYRGRTSIQEVMPITRNIRSLIIKAVNPDLIRDEAVKGGMSTLNQSARQLVRKGVTTIEELARIAYSMED